MVISRRLSKRKVIALLCGRTDTSYDYKDQCQEHCSRSTNHQLAVVAAELLPSRESRWYRVRHRNRIYFIEVQSVNSHVLHILRAPSLNQHSVASIVNVSRIVQPDRVALLLGDIGGVGVIFRHRNIPRRGTPRKHRRHHQQRSRQQ